MQDTKSDEKLELKLSEWNKVVDDETHCMKLTQEEEIRLLSSRNANLAQYLKLHPEESHELMVPSGFKECMVRRYERYLSTSKPLKEQNGVGDHTAWEAESFDAMLPGKPKVVSNPKNATEPTWGDVNLFVCHNAHDTLTGEKIAPYWEYVSSGRRVRLLKYKTMTIELSEREWYMMWQHRVCPFAQSKTEDVAEFSALHYAWADLNEIPKTWNDWQWPIGQRIAIILKQLEHRLRKVHVKRPNPCNECCPFRKSDPLPQHIFLSKAEAAAIVCQERIKAKKSTFGVNYDPIVRQELEKLGVKCLPEGANCCGVSGSH